MGFARAKSIEIYQAFQTVAIAALGGKTKKAKPTSNEMEAAAILGNLVENADNTSDGKNHFDGLDEDVFNAQPKRKKKL